MFSITKKTFLKSCLVLSHFFSIKAQKYLRSVLFIPYSSPARDKTHWLTGLWPYLQLLGNSCCNTDILSPNYDRRFPETHNNPPRLHALFQYDSATLSINRWRLLPLPLNLAGFVTHLTHRIWQKTFSVISRHLYGAANLHVRKSKLYC